MNGVIVSAGSYTRNYIAADTPLIAVTDEKARKFSNVVMSVNRMWQKCEDLYAVVMENVMK